MTPGTLDVSRETMKRLEIYAELLKKWNPKINLVSKNSMDSLWNRHIQDSHQIFGLAKHPVRHWADLGSGGGFPGMVIAILAREFGSPAEITLVESDSRKCAFLRTAARETETNANVLNARIEDLSPLAANVVSARALSDLNSLLSFSSLHLTRDGLAIFHKGRSWKSELEAAQSQWNFHYSVAKSELEHGSVILTVKDISGV